MLNPLYLQFGKYKPDWGDVPTWAAAVLALVAGLVAYRAYVVSSRALAVSTEAHETTRKLLEVELERDQEARQDRRDRDEAERRAQADKVAAWATLSRVEGSEAQVFTGKIKNTSDLPVYDVDLIFFYVQSEYLDGRRELIPRSLHTQAFAVVPPAAYVGLILPKDVIRDVGGLNERRWTVGIRFRDAAGVRWERDPYGKLAELPSE